MNIDALKKACSICHARVEISGCYTHVDLNVNELTVLVNACAEAAEFRRRAGKPHAEKYDIMCGKVRAICKMLDMSIERKAKAIEKDYRRKTCTS